MAIWRRKRGGWRRTGVVIHDQSKTYLLSSMIRAIYDSDAELTPQEQQQAIRLLPGLTIDEMLSVIPQTGPLLAASIRKLITAGRSATI